MKTEDELFREYLFDPEHPTPEMLELMEGVDLTDPIEERIGEVTANSARNSKSENHFLKRSE